MPGLLNKLLSLGHKRVKIAGSFGLEPHYLARAGEDQKAFAVIGVTATPSIALLAKTAGLKGNTLTYTATADGTAKAYTIPLTVIDASMGYARAATGGVAGNDWVFAIVPHSHLGGGVITNEDATNKVVVIEYENGVSTSAEIMTAIDGLTAWEKVGNGDATVITDKYIGSTITRGGTAATWAEQTTATNITLHFTNAVTTVTAAVAALNGVATRLVDAYGTSTNTLVTADADTITSLAGGATGISVKGPGFRVTKVDSAVGLWRITFDSGAATPLNPRCCIQLTNPADVEALQGTWNSTNKTLDIQVQINAGTAVEPAVAAGNRINFALTFANTGIG
jgi:hypothetical protein